MMREHFEMNRPATNDELGRFLKSLSYPEICQELAAVDGNSGVVNERSFALCYNNEIQNSGLNRPEGSASVTKKGG